jgi:hypothetical protein
MKYIFLFVLGLTIVSCSQEQEAPEDSKMKPEQPSETVETTSKYSYKVDLTPDVGWGYRVFRGSKLIIDQKHVPAVPGIKGFETREKAELAVRYIMEQVEAGNERPSVSPEELDSLGAIQLEDYSLPQPRLDVDQNIQQIKDPDS